MPGQSTGNLCKAKGLAKTDVAAYDSGHDLGSRGGAIRRPLPSVHRRGVRNEGFAMTDQQDNVNEPQQPETETKEERFPELAELEEKIQRRLRSNQRFLERFMDEDYEDLDDNGDDSDGGEDEAEQMEEL